MISLFIAPRHDMALTLYLVDSLFSKVNLNSSGWLAERVCVLALVFFKADLVLQILGRKN